MFCRQVPLFPVWSFSGSSLRSPTAVRVSFKCRTHVRSIDRESRLLFMIIASAFFVKFTFISDLAHQECILNNAQFKWSWWRWLRSSWYRMQSAIILTSTGIYYVKMSMEIKKNVTLAVISAGFQTSLIVHRSVISSNSPFFDRRRWP